MPGGGNSFFTMWVRLTAGSLQSVLPPEGDGDLPDSSSRWERATLAVLIAVATLFGLALLAGVLRFVIASS